MSAPALQPQTAAAPGATKRLVRFVTRLRYEDLTDAERRAHLTYDPAHVHLMDKDEKEAGE